jgi:glycosyltransferase involved in cell wall biosynthesis
VSAVIAFSQPYVPRYRVELFNELSHVLAGRGHRLLVFSGGPRGEQASRADSATGTWHRPLISRSLGTGRWSLETRSAPRELRAADVLVSELSARNELAWRRSFSRQRLILWGHGKSYVNEPSRLGDRVEWSLARRAAHIMTYSDGGRDYMIQLGRFSPDSVTTIGNSTDTVSLRREYENLKWGHRNDSKGPSALYVGALDSTKRLDFLAAAFRVAVQIDPTFTLTVAGEGSLAPEIANIASSDKRLKRVGDSRGKDLAQLAVNSRAIWMPGRVGLVAVDALALGLPVHTTAHRLHAPEVEFLRAGEIEYLPDDPRAFAEQSIRKMDEPPPALRQDIPTIQNVANNMSNVIEKVLAN